MSRCLTLFSFVVLIFSIAAVSPVAAEETFGGVGLQVVPTINGDLVVLNVLENAPAAQKGLSPGDLIFKVDDFALQGSEFGKVISEHLWGPVGSTVEIFFRRPGVAGENRVLLRRSEINPRLTVSPTVQGGSQADKGNQ
jgi:C-terminal processing protease CtpA/Prc